MISTRKPEAGYLCAAITLLIWSGFVIVSRMGGQSELTVFDTAALRIGTAALVLSPWWVPRLLRPATRELRGYQAALLASLAGIAYPLVAFTGMTYAPASNGAVLIFGTLPLFTTMLAVMFLGERPGIVRWIGLFLILSGATTLISGQFGSGVSGVLKGDLILLAAALIWALFTVLLKRWQVRAFGIILGVIAASALIYLPIYLLFLPKNIMAAPVSQIVLQAVYQGVIVVCVALWTYAKAAELLGAVRTVMILSGVPVVGVLMAVAFLDEPLTARIACGAAITFLGALLGAVAKSPAVPERSTC